MIFIITGTQVYPFDRLLRAVDALVERGELTEEVFAQTGSSNYLPRHYAFARFLDADEFQKHVQAADIVLTHGGTGAIVGALKAGKRLPCILWMWATVAFGATFLYFQAHEYIEAYTELNLTLKSGVYGSTFFMLTGFHGLHVTLGTIMLITITLRLMAGHFKPDSHFGFEGVAWYWHFVDVVWLGLFVVVYWL